MGKNRYIITALLILSILMTSLFFGCSRKSNTTSTPTRQCQIVMVKDITDSKGAKWKIYHLRLELEGSAVFTIDMNLINGDKVDCWYKIEKPKTGGNVDFQIKAGTSVIYSSVTTGTNSGTNSSDRLNFTATQAYGTSYRLVFRNNLLDKDSKETIFTEIIYPAKDTGEDTIFIPLETN